MDATRGIVRESGVQGLYRGLGVTLVEIMPYAALQFGLYDMSKASWKKHQVGVAGRGAGKRGGAGAAEGGHATRWT